VTKTKNSKKFSRFTNKMKFGPWEHEFRIDLKFLGAIKIIGFIGKSKSARNVCHSSSNSGHNLSNKGDQNCILTPSRL